MKIKFIAMSVLSAMIVTSAVYADDMQSGSQSQGTMMQPGQTQNQAGTAMSPNGPSSTTSTTTTTPGGSSTTNSTTTNATGTTQSTTTGNY